jgi:hypothetical protein
MHTLFNITGFGIALVFLFGVWVDGRVSAGMKEENAVRYSIHIRPIFEKRCSTCHGADAPEYKEFKKDKAKYKALSKGPRMDTYPHLIYFVGWPDTGALMRRIDDGKARSDGKPGNMYRYLGDSEKERQENLSLFREWVGNWTPKRWKAITKEELDRITVAY